MAILGKMNDTEQETSSLDNYKEELARDTELGIRNLREKSLTLSAMEAKWAGYYVAEKQQLKRVQEMRQRYVADKNAKEMANYLDGVINTILAIKNNVFTIK